MEKRKHYRVEHSFDQLSIRAITETGPVAMQVVDVSAGGAALRVQETQLSTVEVGQGLLLQFQLAGDEVTFGLESIVRHVQVGDGRRTLGVEFVQPKLLRANLPTKIFAVFNRRKSFRVCPANGENILISAQRHTDASCIEMTLADISADGLCGLSTDLRCESFAVEERVSVNFLLPFARHNLEMDSMVKAIIPVVAAWRIGFAFVEESKQFAQQQDVVMDYVMRRQHDQLRLAS